MDFTILKKPLIKLILSLAVLGVVNLIVNRLPMWEYIDLTQWDLPLDMASIITAVISTIMIAIVLKFGYDIGPTMQSLYPKIPDINKIALNAAYLFAICIAYTSYQGIIIPFLDVNDVWYYDLGFFIIALVPLYIIGISLWNKIDLLTGSVDSKIQEAVGGYTDCSKCGTRNDNSSKFCKNCGFVLEVKKSPAFCSECGHNLEPDAKFCPECGKQND